MKNKKIIFSFIVFLLFIIFSNICMAKDLDKIDKYHISVDPRNDGSLDMTYYLEWRVLDSESEGPLEWVEIGIPNSNVDAIKAISSNIKSARYYKDGGDYIRIDFKKPYYAGEIIIFSFSFHQEYMYDINGELAEYKFIPGWFNNIDVDEIMVSWKATDVKSASSKKINSDNYYVWKDSLKKGKKMTVDVSYSRYTRNFDVEKQIGAANISNSYNKNSSIKSENVLIIIFVVITIFIYFMFFPTGYRSHRGYGYGYRYNDYDDYDDDYYRRSSSCASSCACVSSCACACACAGGGRAGCSKKDFYGVTIRTKKLNKVIKEK